MEKNGMAAGIKERGWEKLKHEMKQSAICLRELAQCRDSRDAKTRLAWSEAGWFYSALTLLQMRMAARPAAKQAIAPTPMLLQPGNTAGMEPMTKPRMAE